MKQACILGLLAAAICWARASESVTLTQITIDSSSDSGPEWSPDGNQIAFVSDRAGNSDIWVMNADGGNPTQLTFNPAREDGHSWSPDGQWILFDTDRHGPAEEFYLIPATGGAETRVTFNSRRELESSWAFTGDWITCHSFFSQWEIVIYNAFSGVLLYLVTDHPALDAEPGFSPAQDRVVFRSDRTGNNEIWIAPIPAGQQGTQVTFSPGDDIQPHWSPNQNLITFCSDRLQGGSNGAAPVGVAGDENLAVLELDIWITNETGSFTVPVTTGGQFDQRPRWSPDGSRIAFQSHRNGNWDIYIADDLPLQVPVEPATWGMVKARFAGE